MRLVVAEPMLGPASGTVAERKAVNLTVRVVEGSQKGNAIAAAKMMPHPITAITNGSYEGILNIGPLMAPTRGKV